MSSEHMPIHGEVVRLLETCRGEGAVVAVMPAGDVANHHHFYAGVSRAPVLSFLEALLLLLGGDSEEGGRRYEEIVVVKAGRAGSEEDLDTPPEEVIHLRSGGATIERGGVWDSWWYRMPATVEPASPPENVPGTRPNPRGGLRGEGRRAQYEGVVAERRGPAAGSGNFPLKISDTETAEYLLKRYTELRTIIETLESRAHPTLLLLELAVLDYANPDLAPPDRIRITDSGIEKMDWLRKWIDGRRGMPSHLDVVFYSRNRARVEAFRRAGLPRRPASFQGSWPALAYRGKNLIFIEYPCGKFPWGASLFSGDVGFEKIDGTSGDSHEQREMYLNRTFTSLLRGEIQNGQSPRIQLASVRPVPPPRPAPAPLISRKFWSQLDLTLLRQALSREYFGADENEVVQRLLGAIEFMQEQAVNISDPYAFHQAVQERWMQASSLLLWGKGGTGKSFLGKLLAQLIYGHEAQLISCQEQGGGGEDPAAIFRSRFFGAPPGFIGYDQPTEAVVHIVDTAGFTVLIIDEVNDIAPGNFTKSMEVLFGILQDRRYLPANSSFSGNEPVSLWNTIILMTANLPSFPPPDVTEEKRDAITRRLSAHKVEFFDDDAAVAFAQWHLPKALERALGGVTVCACDDLTREIGQRRFKERSPDMLRKELDLVVQAARRNLNESGISAANCPLIIDVTDVLRRALR